MTVPQTTDQKYEKLLMSPEQKSETREAVEMIDYFSYMDKFLFCWIIISTFNSLFSQFIANLVQKAEMVIVEEAEFDEIQLRDK